MTNTPLLMNLNNFEKEMCDFLVPIGDYKIHEIENKINTYLLI